MPGNAGFLYAGEHSRYIISSKSLRLLTNNNSVAYMVAGWNGSTEDAPGFPKDGTWTVKHEGLLKAL